MDERERGIVVLDNDQRHVVSVALLDYVQEMLEGPVCDEFFWRQVLVTAGVLEQFCPGLLEVTEPECFGGKR